MSNAWFDQSVGDVHLGQHVAMRWSRGGLFAYEFNGVHADVVGFTVFGNIKLRTEAGDRVNARPRQVIPIPQCHCMEPA